MRNQNSNFHLLVDKADYHSFLLRIWKVKEQNGCKWYLSLENPLTRELISFHDQHAFINYLTQLIEKTQGLSHKDYIGDEK